MDISIVVCTFNRRELVGQALSSLAAQQCDDYTCEILIVDDGSTDGTGDLVATIIPKSSVEIRYIKQRNSGVAVARNTGVRNARGQWIAFMDDDEIADPNWLACLLSTAKSAGADCVGGPCYLKFETDASNLRSSTVRRLLGENLVMRDQIPVWRKAIDPRLRKCGLPGTGNVLIRATVFERVGLFSEGRTYGEDHEFFRRAQAQGLRFAVAPDAIIYHVIPNARLTETYLVQLAAKAGSTRAQIDQESVGMITFIWGIALRFSHLLASTLPGLAIFSLIKDRDGELGRRCSYHYANSYLAEALRLRATSAHKHRNLKHEPRLPLETRSQ